MNKELEDLKKLEEKRFYIFECNIAYGIEKLHKFREEIVELTSLIELMFSINKKLDSIGLRKIKFRVEYSQYARTHLQDNVLYTNAAFSLLGEAEKELTIEELQDILLKELSEYDKTIEIAERD